MSVSLTDIQFAWFSRWNRCHAKGGASPLQEEGEGLVQVPKIPHLSPLPFRKGRGEKGRCSSSSFSTFTVNERSRS